MVFIIAAVLLGVLIGRLRGGRLANLATWPVRAWLLFVVGIAGLVAVGFLGSDDVWVAAASALALIGFGFFNLHLRGMPIVIIGLALGLVPIVLNGAVPVRAEALVVAGVAELDDVAYLDLSGGRRLEQSDDILPVLGDVLPVELTGQVLSFGDLIVIAGLITIAMNATRARRGAHSDEPELEEESERHGVRPEDVVIDLDALLIELGATERRSNGTERSNDQELTSA